MSLPRNQPITRPDSHRGRFQPEQAGAVNHSALQQDDSTAPAAPMTNRTLREIGCVRIDGSIRNGLWHVALVCFATRPSVTTYRGTGKSLIAALCGAALKGLADLTHEKEIPTNAHES